MLDGKKLSLSGESVAGTFDALTYAIATVGEFVGAVQEPLIELMKAATNRLRIDTKAEAAKKQELQSLIQSLEAKRAKMAQAPLPPQQKARPPSFKAGTKPVEAPKPEPKQEEPVMIAAIPQPKSNNADTSTPTQAELVTNTKDPEAPLKHKAFAGLAALAAPK